MALVFTLIVLTNTAPIWITYSLDFVRVKDKQNNNKKNCFNQKYICVDEQATKKNTVMTHIMKIYILILNDVHPAITIKLPLTQQISDPTHS